VIVRFQRALQTGNPAIVLAAAHELPKPVQLRDALAILLVRLDRDPERYPPAAARFAARLVSNRRLSLADAQLTYAAETPKPCVAKASERHNLTSCPPAAQANSCERPGVARRFSWDLDPPDPSA
jgi:hypothetical protein